MTRFLNERLKVLKKARESIEDSMSIDFEKDDPQATQWAQESYELFKGKFPVKKSKPEQLKPGQIWTTKPIAGCPVKPGPLGPKLIFLTVVDQEEEDILIRGIPISDQWQFAGMEDMVILPEESPLGYRYMLRPWAEVSILKDSLDEFLGKATPELLARVQTFLSWIDGEEIEYHYLGTLMESEDDTPWDTYPLMKWSFQDPVTKEIHEVLLGQRIRRADDPRAEFRKMELEDIKYLSAPVFNLLASLQPNFILNYWNKIIALYQLFRGARQLDKKEYNRAELFLSKAAKLDPKITWPLVGLGRTLFAQNRYKEAEVELKKAIQLDPADAHIHSELGIALCAQDKYAESEAALKKAIEIEPKSNDYHASLGLALFYQNKFAEAEGEFKKAIELGSKEADLHGNLGTVLFRQQKYSEAETDLKKAIERNPKEAAWYSLLAEVFLAQDKFGEAEAESRRAVELQPKESLFHLQLGAACNAQDKYSEAEAEFRKAVELDSMFELLSKKDLNHRWLGVALSNQDKDAEAEIEYRKAIELNPENAWYYYLLGWSLFSRNKYAEAEAEFKQAITLDPKEVSFHAWLGEALFRNNKYKEAEQEAMKAIEIDPNVLHYQLLARALLMLDKYTDAGNYLSEALSRSKEDEEKSTTFYYLGKVCLLQNRLEEAEFYLHRAESLLEFKPENRKGFINIIRYSEICKLIKSKNIDIEIVRKDYKFKLGEDFESIYRSLKRNPNREYFPPVTIFTREIGKIGKSAFGIGIPFSPKRKVLWS